jgi:hypothetical protein
VGDHQDRGVGGGVVALEQAFHKNGRLLHQFRQRAVALAIPALELKAFGMVTPAPLPLGVVLAKIRAQQPAPGTQIDLLEIVVKNGTAATPTVGRQQGGGRIAGPAERGAVGGVETQSPQGLAGETRLLDTFLREAGEVVTTLDAVLQVEAAQPVANKQKADGHGSGDHSGMHRMGAPLRADPRRGGPGGTIAAA